MMHMKFRRTNKRRLEWSTSVLVMESTSNDPLIVSFASVFESASIEIFI